MSVPNSLMEPPSKRLIYDTDVVDIPLNRIATALAANMSLAWRLSFPPVTLDGVAVNDGSVVSSDVVNVNVLLSDEIVDTDKFVYEKRLSTSP